MPLANFFDPSIYWQGLGKHLVDHEPSVGIFEMLYNPVDARDKKLRQRANFDCLASASVPRPRPSVGRHAARARYATLFPLATAAAL